MIIKILGTFIFLTAFSPLFAFILLAVFPRYSILFQNINILLSETSYFSISFYIFLVTILVDSYSKVVLALKKQGNKINLKTKTDLPKS